MYVSMFNYVHVCTPYVCWSTSTSFYFESGGTDCTRNNVSLLIHLMELEAFQFCVIAA